MEEHADDQIDHLRVAALVIVDVDPAVRPLEAVDEQQEGAGGYLERGVAPELPGSILAAEVGIDVVVLAPQALAAVALQGQYGVTRRAPAGELLEERSSKPARRSWR